MLTKSKFIRTASKVAALLALTIGSAHATTYDYSYTINDTQPANAGYTYRVTGTFTGTATDNLISNIGDVTGQVGGTGLSSYYVFQNLLPGSFTASGISTSGAVVDLNGLNSNFFFVNNLSNDSTTNWFYISNLNASSGQFEQVRLTGNTYLDYDNRYYNPANFSVVAETGDVVFGVPPSDVPEPTTVALFGLGLMGVVTSLRKAAKKEST